MNAHVAKIDAEAESNLATLKRVAGRAHSASENPQVQLLLARDIKCKAINWVWPNYLAKGKLHILAGPPGSGKTTIALAMAAIASRGGRWPDGSTAVPGNVLVWSGEDDPEDTIAPRLRAAGADLDRVLIVGDMVTAARPFDPATDLASLEHQAQFRGGVSLLIVDPVVSAVTGDSHKNTEVRRALQPIVNLGRRLDCAVLGISHFSKGTSGHDPVERVTGSIAFGAIARIVLVSAKSADNSRLLARAKSNIGPDGGGFTYTLEQEERGGIWASVVRWGEPLEGSARELLGDFEPTTESPRSHAAQWLSARLSLTKVPVKALEGEATAAGFSWRTVERAKKELGVVAEAVGKSDGSRGAAYWTWCLPNQSASLHSTNGGLNQTQSPSGFQGDSSIKTTNTESGGVEPLGATETIEL